MINTKFLIIYIIRFIKFDIIYKVLYFQKKGKDDANDNTSFNIKCIYDNCLVWTPEIQKRTFVDRNFSKLGNSIF